MTLRRHFCLLLAFFLLPGFVVSSSGQPREEHIADLLVDRPNLGRPDRRAEIVAEMRRVEETRKTNAVARAKTLSLPIRILGPGHAVAELMAFEDDRPLYAITYNREAAISTTANTARSAFGVDGNSFTVGVWDAGTIRPTHEAFGGRVTARDGATNDNHATHVGGTIGAAGPNTRAHGMSPAAFLDSYDWNSDKSEMTSRGASYPKEPGAIYVSNHSYGYGSGWGSTGSSSPQWNWHGQGTNQTAAEGNFGKYNTYARDVDSLAYNLPYYLPFWAAGNDRNDNPAQGSSVKIGSNTYSYNSAIHPAGDGKYKAGYDTIGFESVGKNVMTIGAVNDAVTFGQRDLSKGTSASFSTWGPTDDGRIKPDIVANGVSVYSPTTSTDASYGTMSGTSMASPNAAGSAQLLVSIFDQRFPGHAMRASTLKALIIHAADDLGRPGPDYQYGWGLMNTEAAAGQIAAHQNSPGSHRIVEAEHTGIVHSYAFTWDGFSPIRVTLAWTDPVGASTTAHDDRTSRLKNNLDLRVRGPGRTFFNPFVMPYVGDWSQAALTAPATTGKNNTDNVEQVFVASPPAAGVYTAEVTVDGSLTNNNQYFSLIISGSEATVAPPPAIISSSPDSASGASTTMTLHGDAFLTGATVSLTFPRQPDRVAFSHEVTPGRIKARINTEGMAGGLWDVVVRNPDGQQAILPASFAVAAPVWSENFEGTIAGWSGSADPGSTGWSSTTAASRSSSHSYHAPGPATATIDNLYSPVINIPADASGLALSFWHSYDFSSNDGGVIEFSLDGGDWFDPASSGSGLSFVSGGYNGSFANSRKPSTRNPLGTRSGWLGQETGFSEVMINMQASVYAGKALQVRWRLAVNDEVASPGWFIDDIALHGSGTMTTATPQITVAPSADESPVTGATVNLQVEAENSDGSPGLVYTWTVNDSFDYPITFDDNGTETASSTTATFTRAGSYVFKVSVRNSSNISTSSNLDLDVLQTPTSVRIEPEAAAVPVGGEHLFTATSLDQFSLPLDLQPAAVWAVPPAAGAVSSAGLFTAALTPGGPFDLTATIEGGIFGTAHVTIGESNFSSWQEQLFTSEQLSDPAVSGPAANPDGDGLFNLLEYALGGHPLEPATAEVPQVTLETLSAGIHLVMTFFRPVGRSDLTYLVEASHDLLNWNPIPEETWHTESNGPTETITVAEPVPENTRRFLRLRVEHN